MLPQVLAARYVTGYTVWLRFDDGAGGEVDLADELHPQPTLLIRNQIARKNTAMIMKARELEELLQALKARFQKDMHRHAGIGWAAVQAKLEGNPDALRSLQEMEATGGEPDVTGEVEDSGHFIFCDCSAESPIGRRSTCYDAEARASRKEHKPEKSAVEMASAMGIELLTQEQSSVRVTPNNSIERTRLRRATHVEH